MEDYGPIARREIVQIDAYLVRKKLKVLALVCQHLYAFAGSKFIAFRSEFMDARTARSRLVCHDREMRV